MLAQIRKLTRGAIALLLIGLISIAFALWGINDFFSGAGTRNVARVNGSAISVGEFSQEFDMALRGVRRNGVNISQAEAVERGLHRRLLEELIQRRATHAFARDLGVSVSDATVANEIRSLPAVVNPLTGQFDRQAYLAFLNNLSMDEPTFEERFRDEIGFGLLMQTLTSGVHAPASYGALVLAYTSEVRIVSIAQAPPSIAGEIPAPTGGQIQAFYEENRERLQVPEYRELTLIRASAQDFLSRVTISDDEIRQEFEHRRGAMTQPERRTFVRLAAQNEAQARDAATRLQRGEEPQAVAQALGLQLTRIEQQPRDQVSADIADAVFSLAPGGVSAVRAQLSPWAVVKLETVTAAAAPTLESARDQIRQELAEHRAADMTNEAINAFEQARDTGVSPSDAARSAGLAVSDAPPIDAQGRTPNGQPVDFFAAAPQVLQAAFETPESDVSEFISTDAGDIMIVVKRVTPAATRPLEDVREDLISAWVARERSRRLQEIGDEIAQAVAGGESFSAAVRARRLNIVGASVEAPRASAQETLGRPLAGAVFSAREGQVVGAPAPDGGLLVAQVEEIRRADPAEHPEQVEAARRQIQLENVRPSLTEAIVAAIVNDARVERNEAVLARLYGDQGGAEGGEQNGQ
ncbi:MAG: SurA N-terminal domain-containing protein [Hyphomonadaceae bacterium]